MKTTFLPCIILFVYTYLPAQNLLLNPSFEQAVSCPPTSVDLSGLGTIDQAAYWFSPVSSSDYYSPCYNPVYPPLGVPKNFAGYQIAKSGSAYAGIYPISQSLPDFHPPYREYLEGTLIHPLAKDSIYKVEFYIVRANDMSSTVGVNVVTDRMGAYFHQQFIEPSLAPMGTSRLIAAKPQIENQIGRMLYDTLNWIPICGYFRAAGGETFVTIGNFYSDEETNTIGLSADTIVARRAYYLVDDISVTLVPYAQSPYRWVENQVICNADSISSFNLPAAVQSVLWSTGDTTHWLSVKGPGTLWVQGNLGECLFTDTFQILHRPAPLFGFAEDSLTICASDLPLTLETSDCCAQLLWSTDDTTKSTQVEQAGLLWIHAHNECGQLSDSLWLDVTTPVFPDLGPDTVLCEAGAFHRLLLAPPEQPAYLWSTGENTPSIEINEPGQYWLQVQNVCGTYNDTVVYKDLHDLHLSAGHDTILCLTEPILMTATPGFETYAWNTRSTTAELLASDYGLYIVSAANECGLQIDSIRISEANHPSIVLPDDLEINLGDSVELIPSVNHDKPLTFQWSPATDLSCAFCQQTWAAPVQTTDFLLFAEDSLHCRAQATITVRVKDNQQVYVPNVFSPNGDGENDLFKVFFGRAVAQIVSARIYDRWGSCLMVQQNTTATTEVVLWDGRYRGKEAQVGVYTLVMTVRLINGELYKVARDVTLVR